MKTKQIGKVLDAHGIKGELKIILFSRETKWHDQLLKVYIKDVEYKVNALRPNKSFWILKLESLLDRTQAELLKGYELLAEERLFKTTGDEDPFLSELVGFEVHLSGSKVAVVHSFAETMAHFSLIIKNAGGFFEVPYVDSFIKEIDREHRILYMSFPEDLLSEEFKIKDLE